MKGGLVYVSDADPGISRRRYGNGFRYYDPSSRAIKSKAEIARIDQLAVPPAYKAFGSVPVPMVIFRQLGSMLRGVNNIVIIPTGRLLAVLQSLNGWQSSDAAYRKSGAKLRAY
jgi:hypothetical protein